MTGDDLRKARNKLGRLYGLDRPLTLSEMGRLLRLGGANPDDSIRDYERGKTRISGPMSVAVEMMLRGDGRPPTLEDIGL